MFTISSVLSTVRKGDLVYKIELQDAYILSCTNTSDQQEVPQVCLQKQGLPIPSTTLWSEHSPSDIYSFGAHFDRVTSIVWGFQSFLTSTTGYFTIQTVKFYFNISLDQLLNTLDLVGFVLNKKSELDLLQVIQFLGVQLHLDLGRAFFPESKAQEIIAHVCEIFSQQILLYQAVAQFVGFTQLDLRSYSSRLFVPEAITTSFPFLRSDEPFIITT